MYFTFKFFFFLGGGGQRNTIVWVTLLSFNLLRGWGWVVPDPRPPLDPHMMYTYLYSSGNARELPVEQGDLTVADPEEDHQH